MLHTILLSFGVFIVGLTLDIVSDHLQMEKERKEGKRGIYDSTPIKKKSLFSL